MNPIRAWRDAEQLSTREAAVRLGVTHPTVLNWEAGTHFPRSSALAHVARVMGRDRAALTREWRDWWHKQKQHA